MNYDGAMSKRRTPLILSLTFLLSSLALWNQANHYFAPLAPAAVVEVAACQQSAAFESQIEGVWEQYSIHDGQRAFMARLDVRKDGANYLATPLALAEDTYPKHTYRSYDHSYQDGVWTFREDWDEGQVGEFVLTRRDNGEYRGTGRLAGCDAGFETVYLRVSD
jgi:hypothetical protein